MAIEVDCGARPAGDFAGHGEGAGDKCDCLIADLSDQRGDVCANEGLVGQQEIAEFGFGDGRDDGLQAGEQSGVVSADEPFGQTSNGHNGAA